MNVYEELVECCVSISETNYETEEAVEPYQQLRDVDKAVQQNDKAMKERQFAHEPFSCVFEYRYLFAR